MKTTLVSAAILAIGTAATPAWAGPENGGFGQVFPVISAHASLQLPETSARKGSKRTGGTNSKGKGSTYKGGR